MLELLFLLLPIAAAYGWYMGYRSASQKRQEHSNQISQQYVRGLNLLLSEQSDQAVDHFIELLQVDKETIDTHLALGNLFRSRGEVDRAIRIHQNLISRSGLTLEQKNIALQQLAKDYMASGFLDRAERIFEQLVEEPAHREPALTQLVAIYQQTREWSKAIDYAQQLQKYGKRSTKRSTSRSISHYWCELAVIEQSATNTPKAIQFYKKAISADAKCTRANIELGKIFLSDENYKQAITHFENVLDQDPDFISEVLPNLADCYYHTDNEAGLVRFLKRCTERGGGASVELMLAQIVAKHEGAAEAQYLLTGRLIKNPTMKGFYRLIDYHIQEAEEGRAKASLQTIQKLVGEQLKVKPHFRCRHCGFSTHASHWHCPSCKNWGTIKPIRGLDGE
ncbi:tetratricopeptide repeat protein [Vibrio sp. qd031]|uniref:lipopolysaccharide assembly protein LapB n=1 Tax=Vibrio sp. qd031 TaxID=1603038 RepID=UPI000A118EE8|nr:lipopolysaccharide assembly protein LapB [Vibrio sp. qd031]ORT49445.1 tetratricopeptide repeat protein [Vibrio sp. qd031]